MGDFFAVEEKNRYRFNGIIHKSVEYIEEIQLLRTDLWSRFVRQFKEEDADYEGGWRGEYWGKMMRGACFVYLYSRNPQLYQVLTDTVRDMLTAQEKNGRISSYGIDHEFDAWDIWSRKYVLLGMQYYLEICEDKTLSAQIVDSMCRQMDYIMEKIGDPEDGKMLITKATRHWRGLNSSSLLEPTVRLYNITGERRYLDFAAYIVGCGGTDVADIFQLAYEDKLYPYQYPVTKAYEMMSCFEGLLEYYRITGVEKYKTSILNFAKRILESDFTIIGSCGCTHELFDHSTVRQANTNNGKIMQETCVTVTLMKFFYQLTLLTGDAGYVDAFEISLYNAYLGSINTEKVIETSTAEEHPDWKIEPLPFDSYSPLTAGTRGNGIGGLKSMSDNHYYGCCACIGAAGLGLASKMALMSEREGIAVNLFLDGQVHTVTPAGNPLTLKTTTAYPVNGRVEIRIELKGMERFKLSIRQPAWSKETRLFVNGRNLGEGLLMGEQPIKELSIERLPMRELTADGLSMKGLPTEELTTKGLPTKELSTERLSVERGYITIEREWSAGDIVELSLDMRTESMRPIPYGSQVLMNRVVWGANYMIPVYDEEDPMAKHHMALRRGPIILAQENRLGYSVDEAVEIQVGADGYVDVTFPEERIAPYEHILEVEVPLADGRKIHVTDYASAGKLWTEESRMAAWMLVK